jgi:Glycosyltransferase family 92
VNPRPKPNPTAKSRDYVCTRGMYGETFSPQRLADFASFYLNRWKFESIIIYELGMTSHRTMFDVINKERSLRKLVEEGKLIVVDLRDNLQRSYGMLYQEILLSSAAIGQLYTIQDCFSRAKSNQARWVLTVDIDEWLTYGDAHAVPPSSFAEYAAVVERKFLPKKLSTINFKAKWKVKEISDPSICRLCGEGKWDEETVWKFHRDVELPPFRGETEWGPTGKVLITVQEKLRILQGRHKINEDEAGNGGGNGKYAVRLDEGYEPRSFGLGIHTVEPYCVYGKEHTSERTYKAPMRDMYIRHYRDCGNQYTHCEKRPLSWDWFMS